MKCPHCGKQIADSSQFCEYCGGAVKNGGSNARTIWMMIVVLVLLVNAIVGVVLYKFLSKDPNPDPTPPRDTVYVDRVVEKQKETQPIETKKNTSFYMTGTAAGYPCTIQFDFQTGQGRFTQNLENGRKVNRDLRLNSYGNDWLVLDAYAGGNRVSRFRGSLDPQFNTYSGTITNNQGGAINFSVSQ